MKGYECFSVPVVCVYASKRREARQPKTNAVVIKVAQDQNVPPATLLFRWGVSKGVTSVIAKSTNKTRIEENRKIFDDPFDVSVGGSEIDSLDLGHKGTTCFTWVRESDPDEY